jgi:hypothetical protein
MISDSYFEIWLQQLYQHVAVTDREIETVVDVTGETD